MTTSLLYDVEMRWNKKLKKRDSVPMNLIEEVVVLEIRKLRRNDTGDFIWSEWEEIQTTS